MQIKKDERPAALPERPGTTAIGSLPHHNIDAALAFSFQTRIPFLPQIPIRNPWEYMIAQALEGMPGLMLDPDGSAQLDLAVWTGRFHDFNERLLEAFTSAARPDAFAAFEPSSAASSSWQPFLWELEERQCKIAKIQIAGPLTSQWVLRLKDGQPADKSPEVVDQVYRLVLARAIGMCRRLEAHGIMPLIFIDEPALYGLTISNPRHMLGLQQLKLMTQALRKEGAVVGLHCCSNTDWAQILSLDLHVLSVDAALSLDSLLECGAPLDSFLDRDGRLGLGVVPTEIESGRELDAPAIAADLRLKLEKRWPERPDRVRQVLKKSVYTPACGLALQSPNEAEIILDALLRLDRALGEGDL